jgi:hypothetical protein
LKQKEKRRRACDIVLNVAANYNTSLKLNVTFARAVVFPSLLKNFTNYEKNLDPDMKLRKRNVNNTEMIT